MTNDTMKNEAAPTGEVETKTVKATAVRVGDSIKGKVVASIKSGTKWTYFRDADDKAIAEARHTDAVTVERVVRRNTKVEEPHEISAEEMRAHANRAIDQKVKNRRAVFDGISKKVSTELAQQGYLSPQTLGILLTAQADLRLMDEFAALVDFTASSADLVGLQKEFAQRLIDRLVASTQNSTIVHNEESAVTRLMDDCEKESMARYIESARWYL